MWTTRDAWLAELTTWATADAVRGICTQLRCSQAPAKLLAIAAAMAEFADHATGRNMAATRATLARRVGCSPRTVTTAWSILRAAGWAIEAARGHGGTSTHTFGRRPSIWHLTPNAAAIRNFHLPPPGGVLLSPPAPNHSPSAPGAPKDDSPHHHQPPAPRQRRRRRCAPRPLPLQRLAGQLAARCLGVDRGHIGGLCDALSAAGIDPNQWTARSITDALNADMRATGWTWPDRIERPAGFLVSRLRRLTSGRTATRPAHESTGPAPVRPAGPPPPPAPPPPAVTTLPCTGPRPHHQHTHQARNHIEAIRAQLANRASITVTTSAPPHRNHSAHPATSDDCSRCGAAGAPRRRFMPAARAHLCDPCWGAHPTRDTTAATPQRDQGICA